VIRPERIKRDHLPVTRKFSLHCRPRGAGFHAAGHVMPGVFTYGTQPSGAQPDGRSHRITPAWLGASAAGRDRYLIVVCESKSLRDLAYVCRSYGN
jgi:hypothetical protein